MNLTKVYKLILFSILCIICLNTSVLAIEKTKDLHEGIITDMAKDDLLKRLQSHIDENQSTTIDKEALKLDNRFNAFQEDLTIDLTMRDIDVASIIRIIAKEGGMNVVLDESVMGFISAELNNISLNEAMEIILISEELEARVSNNTIFVASRPAMAKKGLNRRYIKTFKLNNSRATYIADILNASIFNKGYKVNEEGADGSAMAALPAVPGAEGTPALTSEGASTGQSTLIDAKTIKGRVETLEPGENFGDAGKLASTIKLQSYRARTADIAVNNNDGGAIVIPDTRTNSILIAGLQKDLMVAKEAIKYLDKPLKQVSIEVSLIELTKTDADDLGIITSSQSGQWQGGFNSVAGQLSDMVFSSEGNQNGIIFNSRQRHNNDFAIKLNAILSKEETKLLANPKIVALNGSESLIKITEQVVSSVETTITDSAITYSADLSDVGIVLSILPKIGDDGFVNMRIRPSITNALPEVLIGESKYGAAIKITPISTREVILQDVRIRSGDTLAIAGLNQEKDIKKEGYVPFLHSLPLLGRLFSNSEIDRIKTELIILITPTVIEDDIATL